MKPGSPKNSPGARRMGGTPRKPTPNQSAGFAIIGVGAESPEYAAASALVFCTLPVQIRAYHTVSMVGLNSLDSLNK